MKKMTTFLGSLLMCGVLLAGCGAGDPAGDEEQLNSEVQSSEQMDEMVGSDEQLTKMDAIPFGEGQFYAVALLGYQDMSSFEDYAALYLDDPEIPIHYISDGSYYLVIPREPMDLQICRNDMETGESTLVFYDPVCEPFIVQCNVSDIFADTTIVLSNSEISEEFSPFISLENGEVQMNAGGVLLTLDNAAVG